MDTRLLTDALVLLEEGTLNAAARRRNMTQPAFSRRIRALEDWLGEPLVVRHANKVELTATLRESEPRIRALLESIHGFRDHARQQDGPARPLVIAAQHSLAASAFPALFARLQQMTPAPSVRLRTRNQDQNLAAFMKQEADIMLGYLPRTSPRIPFGETVVSRTWRRDALVPVVGGAMRDRLRDGGRVPPGTPLIEYPQDSEFGRLIARNSAESVLRLDGPIRVESAFSIGVASMVLTGVGVGWVPQSLVEEHLRSGEMVALSSDYGRVPLDAVLNAHVSNQHATQALDHLVG